MMRKPAMSDRWTVRGVDVETIARIREVSELSGATFGDLLNEAVALWYAKFLDAEGSKAARALARRFTPGLCHSF
jgi:hypothetical protein